MQEGLSAVPGHTGYSEVAAASIMPGVCLLTKLSPCNALQHGTTLAFLLTIYQLLYIIMPNLAYWKCLPTQECLSSTLPP